MKCQEFKVSIIIPIYNAEKYLHTLLPKIIDQSYKNIEIILVDDGSTDNTPAICKKYLDDDLRIIYKRKSNGGVSTARNYGIEISSGDYIVFIDADDIPTKKYVEILLNILLENKVDYVCASYRIIKTRNRHNDVIYQNQMYSEKDFAFHLYEIMKNYANAPWGKIFNRKIIVENNIKFPEGIPYAEDSIFLFDYFKYINSICISNAIVYNYNYVAIESAAKKFYPDFYKYLGLRTEKIKECLNVHGLKYEDYKDKEQLKCFNNCLCHYILNSNMRDNLAIEKSVKIFHIREFDNIYKAKAAKNQWSAIRLQWIFNNLKIYIKEKAKQLVRRNR